MIRLANKELCSGCTACASKCPHRAISMRRDRLGFAYPEIDMAACTDCGICEAVCPFQGHAHRNSVIEVYAVRHKDMKQLAASQSGAAFVALSDVILARGGVWIFERSEEEEPAPLDAEKWEREDRKYGGTVLSFYTRRNDE